MVKIFSIIVLLTHYIYADISFDEFLNNALKNSPYLKANAINITQASLNGDIVKRYENPSLGFQYTKSESDIDKNEYAISVSQDINLWGVGKSNKNYADSLERKSTIEYKLSYAKFKQSISLLFVEYAKSCELYALAKDELKIASRIYNISKERYKAGTISNSVLLQAQVDYEMVEINLESLNLAMKRSYFNLLEFAGCNDEVELNHHHKFSILESKSNPDLEYLNSLNDEALALSELNTHKIERVKLQAGFERVDKQNSFSVGVEIPLTLFNTKTEELELAKLESHKLKLLHKKESTRVKLKLSQLRDERSLFQKLILKNTTTLQTQERLLEMFEDGYKISNLNLLQLQSIKNMVIQTKKSIIKLKLALDINIINTNYIQGAYNG